MCGLPDTKQAEKNEYLSFLFKIIKSNKGKEGGRSELNLAIPFSDLWVLEHVLLGACHGAQEITLFDWLGIDQVPILEIRRMKSSPTKPLVLRVKRSGNSWQTKALCGIIYLLSLFFYNSKSSMKLRLASKNSLLTGTIS
jgi:hypothetical protein